MPAFSVVFLASKKAGGKTLSAAGVSGAYFPAARAAWISASVNVPSLT